MMRISSLVALGALVLSAKIASADIAPRDSCPHDANAGTSCKTDSGNEGTCEQKTRTRYMPPYDGKEPERVESKYMGCVEKAATTSTAPDASIAGNVPAVPTASKRGCHSTGSGTTSILGGALVAGLLWQASRRRSIK